MSNILAKMPNITIPRTRFKSKENHATSWEHGRLIPISVKEIVPGDTVSPTLSSLIRMSNPIAPIFGNVKAHLNAFFVPLRLIWPDAEKFYGDPSNHGKVQSVTPVDPTTVLMPAFDIFGGSIENQVYPTPNTPAQVDFNFDQYRKSLACYLGMPFTSTIVDRGGSGERVEYLGGSGTPFKISKAKLLGYTLIYNEYYRPSNLIAPYLLDTVQTDRFAVDPNGNALGYYALPFKVVKGYDYFTACTYQPQYGPGVTMPLGSVAPVGIINGTTTDIAAGINVAGAGIYNDVVAQALKGNVAPLSVGSVNSDTKIVADLSQAVAANINAIREAFALQKYYERSNYGSHFWEILNAHYGVTSPDGRLQRPDRLGSHSFYINVNQVLSTAGAASDNSTKLGQPGAVSVTGDKTSLFTASFTEPGYLFILLDTKYERSYSSGVSREDVKFNRFEFYSPEFQHLGDQPIYERELHMFDTNGYVGETKVFGYQEHWAEYRYFRDRVSGLLMPSPVNITSAGLDFWTLADNFDGQDAELDPNFLYEDRGALANALVTGSSGPDFIGDFFINWTLTREMGIHSVPGLIDHFGAL